MAKIPCGNGEKCIGIGGLNVEDVVVAEEEEPEQTRDNQTADYLHPHGAFCRINRLPGPSNQLKMPSERNKHELCFYSERRMITSSLRMVSRTRHAGSLKFRDGDGIIINFIKFI